jgi:putative sterol carrier protein
MEDERKINFPSDEWFARYVEELNRNPAYEEAAKNWEGDFLFVITPDKGQEKEYVYYLDLFHGKCREHHPVASRDSEKAEFTLIGKTSSWMKLGKGEIDGTKALLTGKLKLKGNMAKAMKYTRAANELAKTATMVPTEFD